jgi:hypothetical protein
VPHVRIMPGPHLKRLDSTNQALQIKSIVESSKRTENLNQRPDFKKTRTKNEVKLFSIKCIHTADEASPMDEEFRNRNWRPCYGRSFFQ